MKIPHLDCIVVTSRNKPLAIRGKHKGHNGVAVVGKCSHKCTAISVPYFYRVVIITPGTGSNQDARRSCFGLKNRYQRPFLNMWMFKYTWPWDRIELRCDCLCIELDAH